MTDDTNTTWTQKFGEGHNRRRAERYRTDPEYRENRKVRDRERYRDQKGVDLFTCLPRIPEMKRYGQFREVSIDGRPRGDRLSFTMGELGAILGDHKAPVIYRWRAKDILPHPIAKAMVILETNGKAGTYTQEQDVYLSEEVRAMMEILGEHQKLFRYYRQKDADTVRALFAAVELARRGIK